MESIRWKGVLLGGVCAGLLLNASGMASALVLGLPETFARFGVAPSAATALLHSGLRLGVGVASVLVYVGMRGSYGPGPRTAVATGLLVWFIGYVPGSAVLHELGALSTGQLAAALPWGAAEAVAATVLGAWLYRADGGAGADGAPGGRA